MSAPKKPKTWMLTTGLAAFALGYVFLVFVPGQKSIVALRGELRAKQDKIIAADHVIAAIEQTDHQLNAAREFIRKFETNTPREDKLGEVYGQIFARAEESGTNITRLEPHRGSRFNTVGQAIVRVESESTFAQLFDFLNKLERLPAPLWVTEMEIETSREDSEKLRCQITLTVFADNRDSSG